MTVSLQTNVNPQTATQVFAGGASPQLDATQLAANLLSEARSGSASVGTLFEGVKDQLTPVDQGNVLRELDSSGATGLLAQMSPRFPLTGNIDIGKGLSDLVNGAVDLGKQSADWLRDRAGELKDKLASLPNGAANALADSLRGPNARTLTSGEEAQLRKVFGNNIDLSNVRIVNGAGRNPDAKIAFDIGGNPAITEGNTVYIKSDGYKADFSKDPDDIRTLAHEFAHVYQFQKMGFGSFAVKYASDLINIGIAIRYMIMPLGQIALIKPKRLRGRRKWLATMQTLRLVVIGLLRLMQKTLSSA